MSGKTAIVVLGPGGMETARRAAQAIPGARIHGLARRVDDADVAFDDTAGHLRELFDSDTAIVGVCAAGILIRALAPALADKSAEPPVLALAEDGGAVVPLLGGHHGANETGAHGLREAFGDRCRDHHGGRSALWGRARRPPVAYPDIASRSAPRAS